MSAHEMDDQPTVPAVAVEVKDEAEYSDVSTEDASSQKQKSGVVRDLDAYMNTQSARFQDGARVFMTEVIDGTRRKVSGEVYKSRFSQSKGHTVYQLRLPGSKTPYNNGMWYREKDIRRDS
ncbi:hypothetical protein ACEQ8H_000874 [Pleosporales sp. CAS-2024a]